MQAYHCYEDREKKNVPRNSNLEVLENNKIDVDNDKHQQLNSEAYQVAGDTGQGHYEAREIDLAEDTLVGCKDVAACREALLEVTPHTHTCHVEQGLRNAIGRDACESTKHEHIHDGGEHRLDEVPQRTEDGLLVLRNDVTLDVHVIKGLVAYKAFDVNVEPLLLWLNMGNLILRIHINLFYSKTT